MSIQVLWKYWKQFWFRPESPLSISLFRIVFGLIVIERCLLLYPDLSNWFGTRSICSLQSSQKILEFIGPTGLNIFCWMPVADASINFVFWFLVVAAICLSVGLFSRISAACVFIALASFQQQNGLIINGGDILLKMSAFYLIFAPAGDCFSLDAWFRSKRKQIANRPSSENAPAFPAGWPQRLFRFLIALVYFQAFWSKLDDKTWVDGTALYYVLRQQEFLRFPMDWLTNNLWMCQTLTWGALAIECSMFTLVWFKETRYFALAAVLCLHLGIEYSMNLPVFGSLMCAALLVFVPSEDFRTFYAKAKSFFSKDAITIIDTNEQGGKLPAIGVKGSVISIHKATGNAEASSK